MKILHFLLISFLLTSCGNLSVFEKKSLPVGATDFASAIDSLYASYPGYKIPSEWKKLDNWAERGYGKLDGRIFYFDSSPRELYYMTFNESEPGHIDFSVRAVHNGTRWVEAEELDRSERERIVERFEKEIVSKLEKNLSTL